MNAPNKDKAQQTPNTDQATHTPKDVITAIGCRDWEMVEQRLRDCQSLIEYAPELLEACKLARQYIDGSDRQIIEQAIAKAEGELNAP